MLRQLHDELDAAVFDAYGWPPALTDEEILERLVALNAERAAEEARRASSAGCGPNTRRPDTHTHIASSRGRNRP